MVRRASDLYLACLRRPRGAQLLGHLLDSDTLAPLVTALARARPRGVREALGKLLAEVCWLPQG